MDKEAIKLRIKNHIEIRKSLWTVVIILTGGLITLFLNLDSIFKVVLFLIGIPIDIVFMNSIAFNTTKIEGLLKVMEKEPQS